MPIDGSLSNSIDGSRRSSRSSRSSSPKLSCVGIGRAFVVIGAGSHGDAADGRRFQTELRALIRQMSAENRLWGAPRIHGELLKLGFEVSQSTVAKYMVRRRGPPSQGWRAFLANHAPHIAAMDLFVVPTIGFALLYVFVIVRLDRRTLVWTNVTRHPTAEWIARQITEAFPWNEAPRYLIRDRDGVFGAAVTRRLRAMGIRDKPIAPASPWQNAFAERLIGSIRRECVDHLIVFGERHLRRILRCYAHYYNEVRTHRSLNKDAPISRAVQRIGDRQITRRPRRTSSPLRPDIVFGTHSGIATHLMVRSFAIEFE